MTTLSPSKNLKPAKRYAKALIETSSDILSADKIYEDLSFVNKTVLENLELKDFLFSPSVTKGDKKDVLERIFKDRVNVAVLNFIFLLNENLRLNILDEILSALENYINEEKNVLNINVTSAVELNEGQKEALKNNLQNKTGKIINPEYLIDNKILGGLIIKINDTVIDLSLIKKIENLRK